MPAAPEATGNAEPSKVISGTSSPLRSPSIRVCLPQSAGSGSGLVSASRSSKLTTIVPPLRLEAKVMVCAPGVLLAAIMASRSEMRPSAPGKSPTVPVPQRLSALNGGSAVSARVVTTMVLAEAGGAKPPRTRPQATVNTMMKPTVILCVFITFLLLGSFPVRRAKGPLSPRGRGSG